MIAIILFILILGLLVFVHELGHFVAARRNGVKAGEFGFGFPPRICGYFKNEKTGRYEIVWGNREIHSENTIYSINWLPLGGFVKIKGADTLESGTDSFVSKGAWPRIKILAAGVVMNFILAWILLSFSLMLGAPEVIDGSSGKGKDAAIQINEVVKGTPAEKAGIKAGDHIISADSGKIIFNQVSEVQDYIKSNKDKELEFVLKRGNDDVSVRVTPRENSPGGQVAIGISLAKTEMVSYPFPQAFWFGALEFFNITGAILLALGGIIASLFSGQGVGADVAGPIGIAILTKQVATLGLTYILRFAALLSINLGIINILPIPALDGGRILFILIEKIKGSPVSQDMEHKLHTIGFILLIILMIMVTLRDVVKIID